jgi:hypothetical protein
MILSRRLIQLSQGERAGLLAVLQIFNREKGRNARKKTWVDTSFLTTNLTNDTNLSWLAHSLFTIHYSKFSIQAQRQDLP